MRVLVADDSTDAAQSLAMLLGIWGFEPVVAHDGVTALARLRDVPALTLALLDWNMPGMNGIDICRLLRQDSSRPYTYLILVTGRGREQMVDGLESGADDYLIKPVDPDELRARLNTARRILDLQEQLLETQRKLRELATRDALTGLWNRAMILDLLEREMTRSRRGTQPLSIVMADIDHFKHINDTCGHLVGDAVLRQTAQRLLVGLRPYDTVGRYGGEEFLILLPGCDADAGLALAERLRRGIAGEPVAEGGVAHSVTLSMGVATWDAQSPAGELLRRADQALYAAKSAGRNCVVRAEEMAAADQG
jgi:two-component system, cell cycle response regulator